MALSAKALTDILETLVRNWGERAVREALNDAVIRATQLREKKIGRARKQSKPSFVEIAKKVDVSEEMRPIMIEVARSFASKSFLPSIGAVKEFLLTYTGSSNTSKTRSDAFRDVLKAVVPLPAEEIRRLLRNYSNAGPTRLAPISDAISDAGARLATERLRQEKLI